MKEYRFMGLLAAYYNWLLVLTFLTAILQWFDGSPVAFLQLGILLLVPYLISKVRVFLYSAKKMGTGDNDREEGKLQTCHVGLLIGIGLVASPGTVIYDKPASSFLCCLLYVAAVGIYFYWCYYRGKYLVLHRNPSVSRDTRTRAEGRIQSSLVRLALIGTAAVLLIFIVAGFLPEMPTVQTPPTATEEPEQKAKREPEKPPESQTERPRLPEEQKKDSVLLLIVRYVAWALVIVFAVIGILLILFKIILFFAGLRHTEEREYYEEIEEETDNEEYSRLIPVMRREVSFPDGNAGKVRKIFYRAVKKGADGSKVERRHTPQELREKYLDEREDSEFLTELYEKARYSTDEVSDEEVDRISRQGR